MKIYKFMIIALLAVFIGACNTATEQVKTVDTNKTVAEKPDETKKADDKETVAVKLETPTAAIESFVAGIKAGDEAAIKNTLSEKSQKMLELMSKVSGKSFIESLTDGDKEDEMKELPEMKNEKIDGDNATLEVKGKSDKKFTEVKFVKEEGSWKIAFLDEDFEKNYEMMSKEAEKKAENPKKEADREDK